MIFSTSVFIISYYLLAVLAQEQSDTAAKNSDPELLIPQTQNHDFDVSCESKSKNEINGLQKTSPESHFINFSSNLNDPEDAQNQSEREKRHRSYSDLNRNEDPASRVYRTYGRGKAQVNRQGHAVHVPNETGRNARQRSMPLKKDMNENEIKTGRLRLCRECPSDQKVIAVKGNTFALLPEPCPSNPKMWSHHSGPRPGQKITEGVHVIRGYIGPKKKFCEYNYEVIVRRCENLRAEKDNQIKCTSENAWGSICNVTCSNEKEAIGATELVCKEDLKWTNPLPSCKSKYDCTSPKAMKTNSDISCQTANMRRVEGNVLPNGSTCKFHQNGKEVSLNCKDGKWRVIRKNKNAQSKKLPPKVPEKKDPCNPSPCENGGTCLRPDSKEGPPICKCRPQTRGIHCEMRECYYNICENDGLCFFQNQERLCYCTPDYSGETCQNYNPQ